MHVSLERMVYGEHFYKFNRRFRNIGHFQSNFCLFRCIKTFKDINFCAALDFRKSCGLIVKMFSQFVAKIIDHNASFTFDAIFSSVNHYDNMRLAIGSWLRQCTDCKIYRKLRWFSLPLRVLQSSAPGSTDGPWR